jgi:hypothetical protein
MKKRTISVIVAFRADVVNSVKDFKQTLLGSEKPDVPFYELAGICWNIFTCGTATLEYVTLSAEL